jgi:hypothetical protein
MAKMGFEVLLGELEKKYAWPATELRRYAVAAEELKKYGLQRKRGAAEQSHYSIWGLGIGEMGGTLNYFYGHRPLDAAKKAYESMIGVAPETEGT